MKFLTERMSALAKALDPEPPVGGLDISESAVRFALLAEDGKVLESVMVPLPAGVIAFGSVTDSSALVAALRALRGLIRSVRGGAAVILSVPAEAAYIQAFSMPYVPQERREEVARLNLNMLSPIEPNAAYADWEALSFHSAAAPNGIEALGVVAESSNIDRYRSALRAGGFIVAALEPAPLALIRAICASRAEEAGEPELILWANESGISLVIVLAGQLHFAKRMAWPEGADSKTAFVAAVGPEIRKMLSFYEKRWGGALHRALVIGTGSGAELASWINAEFGLAASVAEGYGETDPSWLTVCGAALRGLLPRGNDTLVSLGPVGTEEEFVREKVRRFVSIWRTAILTILGITAFSYISVDILLVRMERTLTGAASADAETGIAADEASALMRQAENFNALADKALIAQESAQQPSAILRDIMRAAREKNIVLLGIHFEAANGAISLRGEAARESDIIAFKAVLADNPAIREVALPLSAIAPAPHGRSSFTAGAFLRR